MPSLVDYLPLFSETVETIRARIDADANAGLGPEDDGWIDVTVGGFYYDLTQVVLLEIERLWDAVATEFPAAAFVGYAWGEYLDLHGDVLGVPRKGAAAATGEVRFEAPDGTFIAQGTEVAVPTETAEDEDLLYLTTADRLVAPLDAPTGLTAIPTTGGALAAGTYEWVVTAVNENGETVASAPSSATVGGGGTSAADLAWTAVTPPEGGEPVTGYRVYRGPPGGPHGLAGTASGNTFTDPGGSTTSAPPSANASGGSTTAPVEAEEAGSLWNVPAGAISLLMTPVGQVTSPTNPQAITGGADVETDEAYKERLALELSAEVGGGTIADYERWSLAYPGVGHATVQPVWDGPGTVRVLVTDPNNDPVSAAVVDGLQAALDPVPEEGRGIAPIGHVVTVATPTVLAVDVAATVAHLTGYSLDGATGESATRGAIEAAVRAYVDRLEPGEDVLLNRAEAAILSVEGVYDVSGVTLNGSAANAVVGATEVAASDSIVLA